MASSNKTYIQITIDNIFKKYDPKKSDIESLRKQLYGAIQGNEDKYADQIEQRLQVLSEQEEDIVKVNVLGSVPKRTTVVRKKSAVSNGKVVGSIVTLAALTTAVTLSIPLVSHGSNEVSQKASRTVILTKNSDRSIKLSTDVSLEVEPEEKEVASESSLTEFATVVVDNTANSMNSMLENGVRMVDFDNLTEEQQKDLIAGMGLQYYLVANIDDITTLEYANFMQEQSGAVLDNNALIYNFRNMNVLLKQQMLVCSPDNKIDFSNVYQNELDAKLLNDGADILARLNTASTADRKNISKEFYDYVQSTLLDNTDKLQYSNSALATFINSEFGAWTELTKSSGYKRGYYPDDELEAKVMTVVSNCGMSNGEKVDLDIHDETKTSLESINVINVLSTLDARKENISTLVATGMLDYEATASYGSLKQSVIEKIDLTKYHKIESYEDKKTAQILATKPQIHANDSRVSNSQGGTIANSQFQEYGINPSDPNAKQQLEEKVQESYKETIVNKNSNGDVIDSSQAEAWARQGAIDANNGTRNNNVPSIYQEAYDNAWNAANSAKQEAERNTTSSTTYEEVKDSSTTETITDETYEGFKETTPTPSPDTTIPEPSVPDSSNSNDNIESDTTFVPVTDGETTETVIEETTTGFADTANAAREIQVGTLTREDKIQTYKDIKDLIQMISNSFDDTLNIYDEMENHMSK